MKKIKEYASLFKDAFKIFRENHPIAFASAIAYFSLFGLPSIFVIMSFFLGLFWSREIVLHELKQQLGNVIGDNGADMLVVITGNYIDNATENTWMFLLYGVVVFWLSTQLFRLFQNRLNELWCVEPADDFRRKIWMERGITFSLVMITGLLFYSSLGFQKVLEPLFPGANGEKGFVFDALLEVITAILVWLWFALLYKILPSVTIQWGPALAGGFITGLLFYMGIWLLWYVVVERDLHSIYDRAADIILVALWIFYNSLIFLFGASLTKVYGMWKGKNARPMKGAYEFEMIRKQHKED